MPRKPMPGKLNVSLRQQKAWEGQRVVPIEAEYPDGLWPWTKRHKQVGETVEREACFQSASSEEARLQTAPTESAGDGPPRLQTAPTESAGDGPPRLQTAPTEEARLD